LWSCQRAKRESTEHTSQRTDTRRVVVVVVVVLCTQEANDLRWGLFCPSSSVALLGLSTQVSVVCVTCACLEIISDDTVTLCSPLGMDSQCGATQNRAWQCAPSDTHDRATSSLLPTHASMHARITCSSRVEGYMSYKAVKNRDIAEYVSHTHTNTFRITSR
jgi:hypothetical protein